VRSLAVALLLAADLLAAPGEREILARWADAGPGERLELSEELERIMAARRFVEARCVLVAVGERTYTLAELFGEILEPALRTPVEDQGDDDLGLAPLHLAAIDALARLREVHAAPAPVDAATLNLLLTYARDALNAWQLPPRVRLRLFMEVLENVRGIEERARPDARTAWIVNDGILPALLGMARQFRRDAKTRESISKAASLLSMPSILDAGALAHLASLAQGSDARAILRRAYQRGRLDDLGVAALARSLVAQGKDDDAVLAGAAPLLLELLADADVPASVRGEIVDLVLDRMAPVAPLRDAAAELLAVAYGEPPRPLAEFANRRAGNAGPIPLADAGETFRFLQVVMLRPREGAAPEPTRVVRRDVALFRPIYGAGREFVGILVPSADGSHADFLGPSPGHRGELDNRLLRRTLVLERIAIRAYGAKGEQLELCVALPLDGSEPVPVEGARLDHVLDLIRSRLERTQDAAENASLADLLVRIGTPAAREMAVRFARGADDAGALLTLVEKGDASVAKPLLAQIDKLEAAELERALAGLLALGDEGVTGQVRTLAKEAKVSIALPAGDALLKAGDVSGVRALLRHEDKYARLGGAGLALRLTPLAGGLRIIPREEVSPDELAKLTEEAFPEKLGVCWKELRRWLPNAIRKPEGVRSARGEYALLFDGKGRPELTPSQFARKWTGIVREGKFETYWPWALGLVLSPEQPGRDMPAKALAEFLDAFEKRLDNPDLRAAWVDSWLVLAVVQSGLEFDTEYLEMADARLRRLAGDAAPAGARRKPGIYWPIWAASRR